jgi:hypothetical protein
MDADLRNPVELLTSPWASTFYDLVEKVEEELLVASPFLSDQPIKRVVEILAQKHLLNSVHIGIVTNLAVDSLLSGSLDIAALIYIAQSAPNSTITYLPGLHAKIYIADNTTAIVTSANLTNNGLAGNREYGVLLQDPMLVSKVRTDLSSYASLGNAVSIDTLATLVELTQDLMAVHKRAEKSINIRLRTILEQRLESAKLELLKARARNRTTHGIFSSTIMYLLEKEGPLTTVQLHPLIQRIHPDLCDDTIDRVIEGVHFGKKWKHYVRNAQQALKRQGIIKLDGQYWTIA